MSSGIGMNWRSHRSARHAERLGAVAEHLARRRARVTSRILVGRCEPTPVATRSLHLAHPALARLPDRRRARRVELRHLQVEDAARDVVARARLDDRLLGHEHAADRDAVADVGVGHEVRADDAFVRRGLRDLPPHRLLRRVEQRLGEERVRVDLHRVGLRQHVVVVRVADDVGFEGHGQARWRARWSAAVREAVSL